MKRATQADTLALRRRLHEFGIERDRMAYALSRRVGMPVSDITALEHLEEAGPLTPRELAERLLLTPGSVTALIDRLERGGWVRRAPHHTDRRSIVVELTKRAETTGDELLASYLAALDEAIRELSPRERAVVAAFLERCRDAAAAQVQAYAAEAAGGPR